MTEYTLVFRRTVSAHGGRSAGRRAWAVARPAVSEPVPLPPSLGAARTMAQVFAVPICSALDLDGAAYEQFLAESGALADSVVALGAQHLRTPDEADTARKEIQALVMAAEVQHIVNQLSA
ncbi:MAG TPA: hypothetical protein VGR57_17810 [Ktedonobacterales bacterium]|nr:hypothetical protein [Ktedonobacterales bacterium]